MLVGIILYLIAFVIANEEFQPHITRDFPSLLGLERIHLWMNKDLDPCQDFYQYACGGFNRRYRGFQNNTDVVNLMSKDSALLMAMILNRTNDALATTPVEKEIFQKTRNYYQSCLRKDVIKQRGFGPMKELFNLVSKIFNDKHKPLLQIVAELQAEAGISLKFSGKYTAVPTKDIHELRLQIIPAQAYNLSFNTVREIMMHFQENDIIFPHGLEKASKKMWKFEQRHFAFVKHLNKIRKQRHKDYKDQYISIKTLNDESDLDWNAYRKALKLKDVEKVHLWAESEAWYKQFSILRKMDRDDLKTYAIFRLGLTHFNKLPDPYYSFWKKKIYKKRLKKQVYSVDTALTFLGKDCVKETGANLKYLAGHIYIKYAFNTTQKALAQNMVDNLFSALHNRLEGLDWMDESSRLAALKKLDNMVRIVGFPDWVMDGEKVAEYYKPLKFKEETYFENALQAQIFTELMPSIRHRKSKTIERSRLFKDHMWMLNAVNLVGLVQIQINPGFIQRPLFSSLNLPAMNYGSLGFVISHEMTHAFDSYGSQFNSEGKRVPWMSRTSRKEFNSRAKCFVRQYSNSTVTLNTGKKKHINGLHTLTENIADNGGMHIAFNAWSMTEKGNIYEKEKGTNLSRAQIFWLSFAQTNCDISSDKKIMHQLKSDVHSPKVARVNVAVTNSIKFAKAFKCKLYTPMHPRKVHEMCRIL